MIDLIFVVQSPKGQIGVKLAKLSILLSVIMLVFSNGLEDHNGDVKNIKWQFPVYIW